jgi:hypothetical protein
MAIDDDLAVIGKLDFQHAACAKFEIQIGIARFQRRLDPGPASRRPGVLNSLSSIVLPSRSSLTASRTCPESPPY